MTITASNPVYFNAAYAAFMKAALGPSSLAFPSPNVQLTQAQLLAQIEQFTPAAVAFAQAVDTAVQTVNAAQFGGAFDPAVSSAVNVTAVAVTAVVKNGQATRPLALSQLCSLALVSASADNGLQGGLVAGGGAPHVPVPADYASLATGVALGFQAYIQVGSECIT